MPYTTPVVSYSTTLNGTYTALTGIQAVNISRGRRRFQDPFNQTTCVIELIPATSYATPLEVGQFIDVRTSNSASARAFFTGRISDVERSYAIPYNSVSGYAPADRITITALGAIGTIGQQGTGGVLSFAGDARRAIVNLANTVGVYVDQDGAGVNLYNDFGVNVTVPPDSPEPYLELINSCLRAGVAYMDDIDMQRTPISGNNLEINAYRTSSREWTFSDNTTGANIFKYTNIKYLSGAESAFEEVIVSGAPSVGSTASANSGGSPPFNTLQQKTLLNTFSTMLNLAQYLIVTQNETQITPYVISTNTLVADGVEAKTYLSRGGAGTEWFDQIIGAIVTINFRGTTVKALCEGLNIAFYDSHANLEFYFSPFIGAAFVLDSTTLGVLDTDRLGYP
jgi:hypothetical protein